MTKNDIQNEAGLAWELANDLLLNEEPLSETGTAKVREIMRICEAIRYVRMESY